MPTETNDGTIDDPALLVTLVRRVIVSRYSQIAIVALLVYEILITMDKEIKYFWKGPFRKPVTIIYFANRYLAVAGALSALYPTIASKSKFAVWTSNLINFVNIISLDYVLMIRVLAFYGRGTTGRWLKVFLITLLAMQGAFRIMVTLLYNLNQDYIIVPVYQIDPVLPLCIGDFYAPVVLAYLDWIFPMVYDVLLLILALYKGAEYWRMSAGFEGFRLVKVLIRDQAVYFLLAVFCCVFNIMQFKVVISNTVLSMIFQQGGSVSFLAILGARMLFHLKEAAECGMNEGTSYRPKSVSAMEFAVPPMREGRERMDGGA